MKSNTNRLTGLFNRQAYEDDINEHKNTIAEDDYIYVSMDLNELKVVNDTLGHEAGDELIIGATECMKQCLGPYGRLYRIDGDEFTAMIFTTKDISNKISVLFSNFGTSGQIHPDDMEEYLEKTNLEYLQNYFSKDKSSISIFYRRKINDEYKQVMLEIIPANAYSQTNQSFFLYVKNIEK